MADKWFLSDTHFFHHNILKFTNTDGQLIRPGFDSIWEMNARIRDNWNAVVKPQDKVYHLGDVLCGCKEDNTALEFLKTLNGHKRLYLGNHDRTKMRAYQVFEKIELWSGGNFKPFGFVCSHIPLRLDQFRDGEVNVHGHIHQNLVVDDNGWVDSNYFNVCVEHTDYKPVHLDEIIARIKNT